MTEMDVALFDEQNISNTYSDESDTYFCQIVGCIEEIIMEEAFIKLQNKFLEQYWTEFDDGEENKLIYMEIFNKYILTIEKYIENYLVKSLKDFDMKIFEKELEKRQNELDGEIFEMLSTFSDFRAFKSMFLDYKQMKEGKVVDFSKDISISKYTLS